MAKDDPCAICDHPQKDRIGDALRAGTSLRGIAKAFAVGRTALTNHAGKHTTSLETRKYRTAARGRSLGSPSSGILQPEGSKMQPIESGADVKEDLQKVRVVVWTLVSAAIKRSDWKSAERLVPQLLAVLHPFAEVHKVWGGKGSVTVIDARQQKVVQLYDSLPLEVLRRLKAGEVTIEQIGDALVTA